MEFLFEEHRAADAACYLLSRCAEPMSPLKLVRLLYLADRQTLFRQGITLTRDRLISTEDGLALERTLDLAHGRAQGACWSDHVTQSDTGVLSARPHEVFGYLSETTQSILEDVADRYGSLGEAELAQVMRDLPESPQPPGSRCLIDPAAIMRFEGLPEEAIQEATELAASHRLFVGPLDGD